MCYHVLASKRLKLLDAVLNVSMYCALNKWGGPLMSTCLNCFFLDYSLSLLIDWGSTLILFIKLLCGSTLRLFLLIKEPPVPWFLFQPYLSGWPLCTNLLICTYCTGFFTVHSTDKRLDF